MDVPLLRVLTLKSILGFGKYADLSINSIINLEKSAYLRWVYYNVEGISFNEEILDKINIFPEYRITKPGKDPEQNKDIQKKMHNYIFSKFGEVGFMKQKSHNRRRLKIELSTQNKVIGKTYFKKSVLRESNRGR